MKMAIMSFKDVQNGVHFLTFATLQNTRRISGVGQHPHPRCYFCRLKKHARKLWHFFGYVIILTDIDDCAAAAAS
jgi:hypothetical protein